MQLKFKKVTLLSTIIVYCASFLIQSNLVFLQTWAKEINTPRVNIVAILVDDKIYDGISSGLRRYTSSYVQGKLVDTKALVLPIDLDKIDAYDIYRMLENVYFDGLEGVNSSLVGLIMFGDIPLPVVNQDGFVFPTVYPYVDFENQKYVWNETLQYFVPNGNIKGQAELWHGLINYGNDIQSYLNFFNKIESYVENPDEFIGDSMWYDDFIAQKEAFKDDEFQYYRNKMMFGEDLGYQRYSTFMKSLFGGESLDTSSEIISDLGSELGISFDGAGSDLYQGTTTTMHTTKLNQQEIENSYLGDYNDIFSKKILSTIRENIIAGGRWLKLNESKDGKITQIADVDNSSSMIQLKDNLYLGSDDLQGMIENFNDLLEDVVDKKIDENRFDMDIVVPLSYTKITGKRLILKCWRFISHFENYYFGNNAFLIDEAKDLSIFRGTYRNLYDLNGVTFDSLKEGNNPIVSEYDPVEVRLKSIGASYGIFSEQVAGNRGFRLTGVDRDLDIYGEEKTVEDYEKVIVSFIDGVRRRIWPNTCSMDDEDNLCEDIYAFVKRMRGGASPINLDENSVPTGWYIIKGFLATDAWKPIFDFGGFQSLLTGEDEGMTGKGWVDGLGTGPQWAGTNFKSYIKYSSPTERQGWEDRYHIYANHTPDIHKDFNEIDYFKLSDDIINGWNFAKKTGNSFTITSPKKKLLECPKIIEEQYEYKTIRSIVKHKSTTIEEINGIDKDRYGETGTLGNYYSDLEKSYKSVEEDTSEILEDLSEIKKTIDGLNDILKSKISELGNNESQLLEVLDEIESLTSDIIILQDAMDNDPDNEEMYRREIQEKKNKLKEKNEQKSNLEKDMSSILSDILDKVRSENLKLADIYVLMASLYADNIVSILEQIIYMEGLNSKDFYNGTQNESKVGFLPEWLSNIDSLEKSIREKGNQIISVYENVYSLLVEQQSLWNELYSALLGGGEIADEVIVKAEEVNVLYENIFIISDSDGSSQVVLTENSASELLNSEDGLFGKFDSEKGIDEMFLWIIGEDTLLPEIVKAAMKDSDFMKWLNKKGINYNEFSQIDWANQYAQWANGPGYATEGAKMNHELLQGLSEHMSGMNILTPDRPIDSPRYVSMQSVAGNDMKFIYPDLFKVEVYVVTGTRSGFDVHELLTGGEIKKNIIKYLTGKVYEYNKILEEECKSALAMDKYFVRLKSLGFDMATPDPGIHSCGSEFSEGEFIEALGGDDVIDSIAEILYYQNLTNVKKLSSLKIEEDIDFIKKSFDLNERRRLVLKDYLTEGNNKVKSPIFVIPMYELSGYEVAYVNSNGRDYIFPNTDKDSDFASGLSFPTRGQSLLRSFTVKQPTSQENDYNDECNIPSNGRLPLFKLSGGSVSSPWFVGFKCWLQKTLKEPLKIRLSFDNSLGDVLVSEGFGKFMESIGKEMFSETQDLLTDYGDAWTKYYNAWDEIITPKAATDSDKIITQLQVEVDKHNQSLVSSDIGLSSLFGNIKVDNENDLLSDSDPISVLRIGSLIDVGDITVQFIGVGDGCVNIGEEGALCSGDSISRTFNPKTNPFVVDVSSADHKAGKFGLHLIIGLNGGDLEKVIKYTISPSYMVSADILVDDAKTVAGMISPVKVIGYDIYGNVVDWGVEKYDFTVSQGRFLKDGAYQDSFTTNDFRDLKFYYWAPLDAKDGSEAIIHISSNRNPNEYLATYNQLVVQGFPEIKLNGSVVLQGRNNLETNQIYKLKSDESIYESNVLSVSKLQRLDVDMKDPNGNIIDVDSEITVTSQNGLVVIGQVQEDDKGNTIFFDTAMNYMSGGHATIYYYPSTIAGDDVIKIDIPGLDTRNINLKVYPAPTANVQANIREGYVELGDTTDFEIFATDIWGNPVDETVYVSYDHSKVLFPELIPYSHPIDQDEWVDIAEVKDGYLKTVANGTGAGLTEVLLGGRTSIQFKVDDNIFPETGLNIMYLNYFGNDRGNERGYFSDNNKYIEKLMTNSNKIIATTTQLVSEDKIKRIVWKIEPGFRISNYEDVNTVLALNGNKSDLVIGGLSSMQLSLPSLTWMSVSQDQINDILGKDVSSSKNYVFFMSNNEKYTIDMNGVLYDDGLRVGSIANGEIVLQLSDYSIDNRDNVRDVIYRGVNYGSLVLHYPRFMPSVSNFAIPAEGYLLNTTFSNGSTSELSSVGIFDLSTDFELETSYKSIQNSNEVDERIGFLGDFKNITLFAEGEIVGEASRKFGSEFVINLGDPVLSRKDLNDYVYGSQFDGGIGTEIYADSENNIFGTYQIDFNNDGLEDLLVVYIDGSIKLAKNYGGTPDLRNMQELMRIAVSIKQVFIGDADGNGYDDLIIYTSNDQLRAYLNEGGRFDVDGSLACLNQNVFGGEISSTPSNLEGLFQIFMEDMDQDGLIDVITYDDKGYIKVFYGGSTKIGPNYLSTEKYACDSGWYNREAPNTTVVAALGTQVSSDDIFDNSLLHWVGMERPTIEISEDELPLYGIHFDPNALVQLIKPRTHNVDGDITNVTLEIMGLNDPSIPNWKTDISEASQQYIDQGAKYVDVTLYENTLVGGGDGNNYIFAPSSYLDPNNPSDVGSVWKNYYVKSGSAILQDGDIVTVRVTVKASDLQPFVGSYGDVIQGPWNLYYDDYKILKGIRFISNQRGAEVKKQDGYFSYIIDNITLGAGEKMVFEYDLEYNSMPLREMSVTYDTFYSSDSLPDIKLQSVDGCEKDFDVYYNGGRSFTYSLVPLQKMIDEEYIGEDANSEDYTSDVLGMGSDVNQLPGIIGDYLNRTTLVGKKNSLEISDDDEGKAGLRNAILSSMLEGGVGIGLDIDLSALEKQSDEIDGVIDDIMKGMCNGFSFGGSSNCKGLPVPYNVAFLAPGKYHLFGCWKLPLGPLEGGIPVFHFPGTMYAAGVPVPIPWGLKGATDGFLWPGGGTYQSFIRIYAAPTMTAQLGIAICMGNYAAGFNVPSPLSDIGGNCIIFAVKPQCSGGGGEDGWGDDQDGNPNQVYSEFIEDVRDSGVCLQSQKGFMITLQGYRSTPFNMYSYSANKKSLNGGAGIEYNTNYMGIIELETTASIGKDPFFDDNSRNSIVIGNVDILAGDFSVNKIKGGLQQGIRKLLIDKWLDPQIRYILNQLTKMHINIKFPNMTNLIDNEVQTLKDVSQNIGKIRDRGSGDEDQNETSGAVKKKIDPVSTWSSFTNETLAEFNKSISNPFEALASLMNESNIINISTETINVKIPMVFKEDIDAYYLYLQQWLDINQKILDEWTSRFETLTKNCSKEPTPEKQQICKDELAEDLTSFINFKNVEWERMKSQIYANLIILQQYRNFPFEIYEWIHVIDIYMAEIANLINNTIGYLAYWTSTNSERFAGYVDAIVLIINIIKTYQILIDFSIDWGENCGNCARDTYDQYSCKLALLCEMIQLPIIQIPNFKLPNITIDLTNIDIGLDIVLPEFNFQPVRINLPQLPNLPEPPSISVNIKLFDLPDIPLLPAPPELPELPSFIPEIELELPILPPAPEVPRLPSEIEGLIKVAKLIGRIYCIVKGQFGLVGESSVKAKIEQLTQRTYDVDWIDTIMDFTNRSFGPVHNYGVDYEIDSYVDFQFNFTDFYDYLDMLTKSINNLTTSTVSWVNSQADSLVNDNPLIDISNDIDGANIDIDGTLIGEGGLISFRDLNPNIDGIVSDDIEYVDYQEGKDRLNEVLTYFRKEVTTTPLEDNVVSSIEKIENQINRHSLISANDKGIKKVGEDVMNYLNKQKVHYDSLAELINSDYDKFLAMVDSDSVGINGGKGNDNKLLTFSVQLFDLDSDAKDSIKDISKTNPYKVILDNKKTIIDGYMNAVDTNSAEDLGIGEMQYLVLRNKISSMENGVSGLYNLVKPASSTNLIAKDSGETTNKSLVAAKIGARIGSQLQDEEMLIDPSLLSRGIYEKSGGGGFVKVVYSDKFTEDMINTHYRTNHTSNHDIILWSEKSIFKKCGGQKCAVYGGNNGKYYHSKTISEIPYEETWIEFDSDTKLKIADDNEEVKNRKVSGQDYDVLSFSWDLEDVDGYLIKLVERIDYSYEKSDYGPNNKYEVPHYVLALPDYVDIDEVVNNLKLELYNKKPSSIKNLSGNEIFQIIYYNTSRPQANIGFSNLERKWYYTRISTLDLVDDTYMITSPWSNQVVAGSQILGDDQAPSGSPLLIRKVNQEITSEGDDLEGYVGTRYELKVNRSDNVALSYINLSQNGKILNEKYTSAVEDSVSIDIDLHTKMEKETYTTKGIDQFGNTTEKNITVSFLIPEIEITDISRNSDGESIAITAELSQDIDQGNVAFQKRRGSIRKSMLRKGADADISIGVGDRIVVGSPYSAGNEIAMYDKNQEVIALMDPYTAEIKIQSGYSDIYEVRAVVGDSSVLQVYDKNTQKPLFSLTIPSQSCVKFDADGYNIVDLPESGRMGVFNGGKAIYKDGMNVLFVSPTCYLRSEYGLEGTYDFDRELDAVLLTLYEKSDFSKKNPIKVWFRVEPFFDN